MEMFKNRLFSKPVALSLALIASVFTGGLAPGEAVPNQPPAGFTALFNGQDLTGWFGHETKDPRALFAMTPEQLAAHQEATRGDIKAHWRVENGQLINDGNGLYLSTNQFYGDFELRLEYKTVAKADSGIYLRGCPQVQIWDSTDPSKFPLGADKGSGGLWNNSKDAPGKDPSQKMDKPFGEWNEFHIRMIGERVTVTLNGTKVVDNAVMENYYDRKLPIFPRGPIQLQTHGGEIRWRNVFLREILAEEANQSLRQSSGDKFTELISSDLGNWQGAVDNYELMDGKIIRCKEGKGGNLLTKEEYGDLHLRFEFRLPPNGNNGIALRAPLEGDAAYGGFEVQVLDDTGPVFNDKSLGAKYYELKPWQVHGSLYTLAGAVRGYLRPTGEWNYEEIILDGQHFSVTLNGTKINDAQLDKLDLTGNQHQPLGLKKTKGFIGFAGHNDPVEFRNFAVKRLGSTPQP